ncbi:GNAT family N-acetyltransferase [Caldichromatium japonicum]|uniref:L-ornithine N(alpha)-acyltransferase n=1 Tax=Caldichromatium japonicum TaxID=2699430 RepID=A0A6G7VEL5_9GAMM|nr:GNAT family N-acyltransferase [Caldichromatium japonicum]QIK38392.1 GNAT family N-acetyltransferase [Caldichromatium japonicum]
MVASVSASTTKRGERLYVEIATSRAAVREAQALRYRVFGEEMGAQLKGEPGYDHDEFDDYCQHLLVRDSRTGRVVGCTRLLTDTSAQQIGRFYSEGEFDLSAIKRLNGRLLEVGRTCIATEFRQGPAIAVLWSGLAGFIQIHGFDYLFGCASLPLGEYDLQAAAIMNRLRRQALAPEEYRVKPRLPLLTTQVADEVLDAPLPPLLRTYIRLGAKVCGEPCRDPDFGVADVLILLNIDQLNPAYSRHFLERYEF